MPMSGLSNHDLRQVGPAVLGVAVSAQPTRRLLLVGGFFAVASKSRCWWVSNNSRSTSRWQVRDGEEHRLLHLRLGVGLDQRSIARYAWSFLIHAVQAADRGVARGPLGRGQLRLRVERPVRDQREQHPLDAGGEPATAPYLAQRAVDAELAPQRVEQPTPPRAAGRR